MKSYLERPGKSPIGLSSLGCTSYEARGYFYLHLLNEDGGPVIVVMRPGPDGMGALTIG